MYFIVWWINVIINVQRYSCKVPVIFVTSWWNLNFFQQIFFFSKNTEISNIVKISLVAAELFHVDGQTDITNPIVALCSFANVLIGSQKVRILTLRSVILVELVKSRRKQLCMDMAVITQVCCQLYIICQLHVSTNTILAIIRLDKIIGENYTI